MRRNSSSYSANWKKTKKKIEPQKKWLTQEPTICYRRSMKTAYTPSRSLKSLVTLVVDCSYGSSVPNSDTWVTIITTAFQVQIIPSCCRYLVLYPHLHPYSHHHHTCDPVNSTLVTIVLGVRSHAQECNKSSVSNVHWFEESIMAITGRRFLLLVLIRSPSSFWNI